MTDIQRIGPDDWRIWRALRLDALAESPGAFRSTLAEWTGPGDTEQRWRNRVAERALNLVVILDAEPAGMASAAAPNADGAVQLHSIWVAPFARGRGVGDAAVGAVLSWAAHEHPGSPMTLTVMADNESAIRLYRRHGFADIGTPPGHPAERRLRREPH